MAECTIFRLALVDGPRLVVEVSWVLLLALAAVTGVVLWRWRKLFRRRFDVVSLDVQLGSIGKVAFKPSVEDIQVAHRIWTELVTRKAAIPIDPDHDVIVEVYDSWYVLFGKVRQLIADLPALQVREDGGTRELVRIATEALNKGLRPHLTRWQARFRHWYATQGTALETRPPQEVQRDFPEYGELMTDMRKVNEQLIQYAGELQKVIRGR